MDRIFRVTVVAGARPNFMKLAPVVHAFSKIHENSNCPLQKVAVSIVHTGQHYDPNMSDIFFRELGIPRPDCHLEVGSGSHAEQTAKIMISFEKYLHESVPDLVVVVGDVNSTIACALTAKKMGIEVAHVEAGLRSFDMDMPEEINRKLTDAISDLLFVTEESGIRNLEKEGVPRDRIFLVGNVMIDNLKQSLIRIDDGKFQPAESVRTFCNRHQRYAVLTLHRPSNVDSREMLEPIWGALEKVGKMIPVLFPVHPRTRGKIDDYGLSNNILDMIEPIGYLDMLFAVRGAAMVITDSGGLQEETTVLEVPCITIRKNTERPITVEMGTNYLAGTKPDSIVSCASGILEGKGKKGSIPPMWDGHAAERIVEIILSKCYVRNEKVM